MEDYHKCGGPRVDNVSCFSDSFPTRDSPILLIVRTMRRLVVQIRAPIFQYLRMEAVQAREQCSGSVNISYGSRYADPYS
jgi:hypothetical protein